MHGGDEIQMVVFQIGDQQLALEILQVERILRYERPAELGDGAKSATEVESMAGAEPATETISYDGRALALIDLRRCIGVALDVDDDTRIVVVEVTGRRLGLVVDRVREVLRLDSKVIAAPPPNLARLGGLPVIGAFAETGRTVLVLNASPLLRWSGRVATTAALEA